MINQTSKIAALKQNVEELGVFFETTGLTPMESRVFALLLLSDPPERCFNDIWTFLSASKNSGSVALRRLAETGKVTSQPGAVNRRRAFRADPAGWLQHLEAALAKASPLAAVLDHVVRQRTVDPPSDFSKGLTHVRDFLHFVELETADLYERRRKITNDN
ncbi:GbsR/MarR family transcriptional regulator [Neolewinella antarctica]|uniref:DNA-binding transcriptional regulator GbsR (MarR family) n=1 Tax=Neolewinella antarctica TaxID=442734 RepID=A0ABX0X9F6_9BACT|nr:hypothetical protein [Neolewinella antarctica]NJC25899.1 DNA-binding transcriptional regulator GbsR (MarR family) [Neolewinella antarctica]